MGIDKALKKATSGFSWSDVGKASVLTGVGGVAGFLTSAGSSLLGNYLSRGAIRDNSGFLGAQQFGYAKKYALNSPSWNVEGLRAANLNPILAATDGAFSSPTVPSIDAPTGELSGHGQNMDVLSAYNAMQNLKMARARTKADVALAKAQKANVDADTELKKVNKNNSEQNRGLTGTAAAVSRILSELGLTSEVIADIKQRHHPSDQDEIKLIEPMKSSKNPDAVKFVKDLDLPHSLTRPFPYVPPREPVPSDLRKRQLKSYKARSHRRYSP